MKSIIALILSALMAIVPVTGETAVDEIPAEVYMIEGIVAANDENGILVSTIDIGDVLVQVSEETVWDGTEAPETGDYVYVDYSGMMSRSLPPRITAQVIRSWQMDGTVTEVFAEENAMLVNTETHGDVYVRLPAVAQAEEQAETEVQEETSEEAILPQSGDKVTVYFNGVMTMSLPGQINAGLVVIHTEEAA